jgi:hypothetical protein
VPRPLQRVVRHGLCLRGRAHLCGREIVFLGALLVTSRISLLNFPSIGKHESDLPRTSVRERHFRGEVQYLGTGKGHLRVRKNKEGRAFDYIHCLYAT